MSVSVIIPTRHRPARLAAAVACARAQEGAEVQLIVVHDGPDPEGFALAPARDAHVITLDRPRGMAAARNAGARAATGRWLAFLDDDDLWAPPKLRGQLDAAAARGAELVYSAVVSVTDERRPIAVFPAPPPTGLHRRMLRTNAIPAGASNVLVGREAFLALGAFDETLVHLADWDAWIRLTAALPTAADAEITVAYVQHAGAMSARDVGALRGDLAILRARHGGAPDEALFDRWLAGKQRRAGRRATAARLFVRAAARGRAPSDLARAAHAALGLPAPRRRVPDLPWLRV